MTDKRATSLCDLPTEIQHLVVLNLHPAAAIALKRTNRWFHTHISLHRLDKCEVARFLLEHENLPKFSKNTQHVKRASFVGYACFHCLRIKPAINFTQSQVTGHYAKRTDPMHKTFADRRSCIECSLQKKEFLPDHVFKLADGETVNIFCPACQNMQSYFCYDCYFCAACIAKSKWWTGKIWRYRKSGGVSEIVRPCQCH